ncbi:MAG: hypothetical protein K0A99_02695 [Desulfoarculaceae bacterium]|nr:hypothetical protein [Desulfoarculaceae bacterium]
MPGFPVILCSRYNKLVNSEEARALGIHACQKKPVSVQNLTSALRKALDEKGKFS